MKNVAVIIPAHNEEKIIKTTLNSLKKIIRVEQIFLVNDNSTDKTIEKAKIILPEKNVVTIDKGRGKASALNFGIKYFNLTKRFKYIMPIDADTIVSKNFFREALKEFEKDGKKEIIAVSGKVIGKDFNKYTSYRLWEYEIGQSIIKKAQNILSSIVVSPGCSTIFRSKLFKKYEIPTDTVTEDMDLTFQINRLKKWKIVYSEKAVVQTQDPQNIKDYLKQVERWYTGFWQCVLKHDIPWGGQYFDLEVGMLATDGLVNGFLVAFLILITPVILISGNSKLFLTPLAFDFFLFLIPTIIYASFKNKTEKLFIYAPFFYIMRIISSLIYLKAFIRVALGSKLPEGWNTRRYKISEELIWCNLSQ